MINSTTMVSLVFATLILYVVDCLLSSTSWLRNRLDMLKDELVEEDRKVIERYLLGLRAAIEGLHVRVPAKLGDADEDVASEMEVLEGISKQLYEVMVKTMHVSGKILAQAEILPQWPKTVLYELLAFLATFGGTYLVMQGYNGDSLPVFILGVSALGVAASVLIESYESAKRAVALCNVLHERLENVKAMLGYKKASDASSYKLVCENMPRCCRLVGLLGQVLGRE